MVKDTKETLRRFEETVRIYLEDLDRYDMDQLTRKPGEDKWSLGQMFMHIINSAIHEHLGRAEECRERAERNEMTSGDKTEPGEALFVDDGFPPVQIVMSPGPNNHPPQPESKEQVADGFRQAVRRMHEVEAILKDIPDESKVQHRRLGWFNAKEWFTLSEFHYRHHLRQRERIIAFLNNAV